jgi:hypothetical protein
MVGFCGLVDSHSRFLALCIPDSFSRYSLARSAPVGLAFIGISKMMALGEPKSDDNTSANPIYYISSTVILISLSSG